MVKRSHKGLVQRDVTVKRGGKTFTQKRWVKPGEDEPVERKGKKEEVKGKESYKIGETINFLGKNLKIEKVSESQKTVKLSNRKVYTFDAIESGKSKEKTIKDLKVIEKPKKGDKKVITKTLPKNKSILLIDLVKSKREANKFVKDHGWVFDKKSNIFPNVDDYDTKDIPINIHTNNEGKIYAMSQISVDVVFGDRLGSIDYLEINTPMRGKGYGRQAIKGLVKNLHDRNCISVSLDSLDGNSDKFYEAIGMKTTGRDPGENQFYGDLKWINSIIGEDKKMNKSESLNTDDIKYDPMARKFKSKKITINKFELINQSHKGLVQRDVTVKRGGKTFTQKRWVKPGEDEPVERKGKKEEVKGKESYKIGETINFLGKNLKIEKVSESQKTVKLSNRKVYTFDAIESGKSKEKTIKDLKVIEKPKKGEGIKLTPDNYKDILVEGKWINVDGQSAIITEFAMDIFVTARLENGKDIKETTFTLCNKDVKTENKKDPIPDKFVFKPVKSKKTIKGKMESKNVDSIKSLGDMNVEGGVNEKTTHVVKFKGGSQAIYKTSGAVSTQGEMNVKGISEILNWNNAPETTEVDLGKGVGSSQRWVENIAIDDINKVKLTEKHYDDLAKIAIIDMITGNWDRHYNNVRLDADGKIWAIDNDTWGDETKYDVNNIKDKFQPCKLSNWSKTGEKENVDKFQTYCDKHVKDVIEHKDEIIKFINDIGSDKAKFKDDFKSGFRGGFGDTYKSVDELTNNMLNNLNRVIGK